MKQQQPNLSDAHGAQDVQEYEGAMCVVIPHQVTVAQPLEPGDRRERQVSHNASVEAEHKTTQLGQQICYVQIGLKLLMD